MRWRFKNFSTEQPDNRPGSQDFRCRFGTRLNDTGVLGAVWLFGRFAGWSGTRLLVKMEKLAEFARCLIR
jgi:hypothetical protein